MSVLSPIREGVLFVGEDKVLTFTAVNDAGAPVDITGWSLAWALRRDPGESGAALVSKTTGAGITITNPTAGVCTVTIAASDTLALLPGVYWHALARTGTATVVARGPVYLGKAATP